MVIQGPEITENMVAIVAILSIFVGFPLSIALARLIWRRAAEPPRRPSIADDTAQRMLALQQSVDAMAIEIERISEGQRFVTKLLSERPPSALGQGAKRPAE